MPAMTPRPRLASFRALSFHGDNKAQTQGQDHWTLELKQEIELGLAVPTVAGGTLQAVVKIALRAQAANVRAADMPATFNAEYEAKFDYPAAVTEADAAPLMEQEPYQYGLVAQAFPLAMTHFRRELQAMGLDARALPLGL